MAHTRSAAPGRGAALLLALVGLVAAGCGADEAAPSGDGACAELRVVATTSILGDVVGNVVGDSKRVEVLIPIGADPHSFQASAAQAVALREADVVVVNGLGLEEGLQEVVASAAADGVTVVEAASFIEALPLNEAAAHENQDGAVGDEDRGSLDPHIWTDPQRMADVVTGLGEALAEADPDCAGAWRTAAEAYRRQLQDLDGEIEAILDAIPAEQRKLVTNHHAFGYFADRYGFEVLGAIIPGGAAFAAPSPADLAALVEILRSEGVRAIFAETTQSADLAGALAAELGEGVEVVSLYTGSLGESGSGADTYAGMQRVNAERIAAALTP
ncbi:MAG: metal ABC transporter substrate-binding protein [Actinomycetota bacterium]